MIIKYLTPISRRKRSNHSVMLYNVAMRYKTTLLVLKVKIKLSFSFPPKGQAKDYQEQVENHINTQGPDGYELVTCVVLPTIGYMFFWKKVV